LDFLQRSAELRGPEARHGRFALEACAAGVGRAVDGVLFRNGWSTPLCGPSRAMIMIGKYPRHTGYCENAVVPLGYQFSLAGNTKHV
jgi:arylsulfatase A-like enzyme